MQNSHEIHYLPVHAVKPYARSARIHSPKQRRKLSALLRKFGQVAPIIVDDDHVIVDGHAIYAGLVELGFDEIAAVVVRNRDPAEIRALRLALNRLPRDTRWDRGVLRDELQDLLDLGFEMELTGFDAVEIDLALAVEESGTDTIAHDAAEDIGVLPAPVVRCGDIYRLGRHLIACGDARDGALLRRLAGGRAVHVVFAAPPRIVPIGAFVSGVGKLRQPKPTMASAEMTQDFTSFLTDSMEALVPVLNNGAILCFSAWIGATCASSWTPRDVIGLLSKTCASGRNQAPARARFTTLSMSWFSCSSIAMPRAPTSQSLEVALAHARIFGPTARSMPSKGMEPCRRGCTRP
jgi:hypothetical protein